MLALQQLARSDRLALEGIVRQL